MLHMIPAEPQGPRKGEQEHRGKDREADDGQRTLPVLDENSVKHRDGYLDAVGAATGTGFVFSDLPSFCR